jgi:hypothetical protein
MTKETLREKARALGLKIGGRASEATIAQAIADAKTDVSDPVEQSIDHEAVIPAPSDDDSMNAYALRIWQGQSPDVSPHIRVDRIKAALIEQGYVDLSGLIIPDA